ncbi:ABC transporter substrate-binding protein [Dactylosporangium sucinum]|uniref:ABC transporter substrate-binding protein n=1 Tax=Dactylosporangium sucinum TaxID=1424081 RepID=A0A917UCJ2_9ACTN|nr:ABC transporter substrate-binding protein [Dactylosporangium sucinum]GGM81522.1 ABC transporter substrate-binding protein [Dactylosporangium sucinum]
MKRNVRRAAIVACLGLLLAACSSGADTTPSTTAPTAKPSPGGTLRVGISALNSADSLDPARATTVGGYAIARQLFDTLTEYGTAGTVVPRLAESVMAGTTADIWTVKLRQATWHDGKPVTADDVIYSIKRILNPADPLPPASSLPFVDAEKVTKVDDRTVQFALKYPTMVFPDALTSPTMAIVPTGFDPKSPIGSGPFKLDAFTAGQKVTFTKNASYFKPVYADKLEFISFADGTAQVNALIGNQIEVASSMDSSLVPVVQAAGSGYKVFEYPTSGTLTWQMNVQQKPFDNPKVRQALRLAVDRAQIVEQVYGGHAVVGNDIFSPFDAGYDKSLPQRERNLAEAKKLLTEAGFPNGVEVQLTAAPIQPTANRQNDVLVQQAKEAGFTIHFNKVDAATYYGDGYGTYPLSLSFWGQLSIFDQAAFTIVNNAPYNATKWQNDAYNTLYEKAVRTVDEAARIDLVHQMQKIEYDEGPYVVAVFLNNISGYSARVSGYKSYPNSDGASGYNFYEVGFTSP